MHSLARSRQQGFTLLELLVVMVVLGLLAGIVAPNLFRNMKSSEITTARAQIDALGKALDQYRLDVGLYPANQQGLAALTQAPSNATGWRGPYLRKAVPMDPWGQPYQYRSPGQFNSDFDLFSFGPDRKAGGDGDSADIGNW